MNVDKFVVEYKENNIKKRKVFNSVEEAKHFALTLVVKNDPTIYGLNTEKHIQSVIHKDNTIEESVNIRID